MQWDGNFVVYDANFQARFDTGTNGYSGAYLVMQGDGIWSFTICRAWLDGRPGSDVVTTIAGTYAAEIRPVGGLRIAMCVGVRILTPDTGVAPTTVNGTDITLPAGAVGYRRAGIVAALRRRSA
jgi:hypothetical protein